MRLGIGLEEDVYKRQRENTISYARDYMRIILYGNVDVYKRQGHAA